VDADYLKNRRAWDLTSDAYQKRHGAQLAANAEAWGIWSLPESELQLLGEVADRDILEFGCGAAQWSISLAKRGARCTGLDNSPRQLEHARVAVAAAKADVRLVHGTAEDPPFADASFDIVFCDHGALSFSAPERTIPQTARLLRSGGILAFSVAHPIHEVCWDRQNDRLSRTLHQSYFELSAVHDPTDGGVSHVRPIATYLTILIEAGFSLEKMLEPRPPADAVSSYEFAPLSWAREFPAEAMFRARRR
jgi:SAM-dependent methyltransferase